jgi:hypothetical protein
MQRPPEISKSFANRLAALADSKESAHLIRLLQLTGMFAGNRKSRPAASPPSPAASDRVGIWERKSKDGKSYFARSMDRANEWNMWANEGRIEAKGAKRRVVLIGESVARGYLYDPLFTPAMVLEKILVPHFGQDKIEVIDLARLSLLREELLELAHAALALEPDAVVIFAGNNWGLGFSSDPEDPDHLRSLSTVSRENGVAGLKRFAEEKLKLEIKDLVKVIAELYRSKNIPLAWIVPEFNLRDWRDAEMNAPYLGSEANREWIAHWERARNAFKDGDIAAAAESAKKMVDLDHGVSVTGLYLLADCSQASGDVDAVRDYLERARDALIWDSSAYVPSRSYTVVQETLREEAKKYDNGLVDLPQIFCEYLHGDLPDRRLFVDHCHLTSDGIQVSMAAAGACLLQKLVGVGKHWTALADKRLAPSKEVQAEAAFLAAVHNAHWWQSRDLVEHFCSRAVQNSSKIARLMATFSELQVCRAPMLMSRAAEEFSELGSGLIQFYTIQYSKQILDDVLLDAIGSSLKKVGGDERARLERLQTKEHSVARRANDLLDYYYCSAARQPRELMWAFAMQGMSPLLRMRSDYYKAYGTESRFVFVGETDCPVGLRLTCRLPKRPAAEGAIKIEVNGHPIGEMVLGRDWETWHISVNREAVRDGLNEVIIRWPLPEFPDKAALDVMFEHLVDDGIHPDFYPVFGEVHSFVASDDRMRPDEIV